MVARLLVEIEYGQLTKRPKDKMKCFSNMLRSPTLFTDSLVDYELIGEGTIRCCYHKKGQSVCYKFYANWLSEDPTHPRSWKTRLRLLVTKHLFWFNINMQEWRYYCRLKKRLPVELRAAFPELMEPVYSTREGWGLCEELLTNYNGSYGKLVEEEMRRLAGTPRANALYHDVEMFFDQAVTHAIALYDPRNLLVQWVSPESYRLRVVDFEPKAKAVIPGLTYLRPFVRRRVRARSQAYLKRLKRIMRKASGAIETSERNESY